MKLDKRFDKQFSDVVCMIHDARFNAIKHVNAELVKLYWNVGKYISKKLATAEWGGVCGPTGPLYPNQPP